MTRLQNERGFSAIIAIIIGIILTILVVGYFTVQSRKSNGTNTVNNNGTTIVTNNGKQLPCVIVTSPKDGATVRFPLEIKGTLNGCGWKSDRGMAGIAHLESDRGIVISDHINLYTSSPNGTPNATFSGTIYKYTTVPETAFGKLVIESVTPELYTYSQKQNFYSNRISAGACGIKVTSPVQNTKVSWPLHITGRVTGCGWLTSENVGDYGLVALFYQNGNQASGYYPMLKTERVGDNDFYADIASFDDSGNFQGYLLFVQNGAVIGSGQEYKVPVLF